MIAKRISEVLKALGLQQNNLAKEIGVLPQTFNGYMTGHRSFPVDVVIKVSRYLGVPSDYLLGLSDYKKDENGNIILYPKEHLMEDHNQT